MSLIMTVSGALEHVQHPLGDDEASNDVDKGDESGRGSKSLNGVGRIIASTHHQENF